MAATDTNVACGSAASACAAGAGSDNALGKTAAEAEPEQNAQCEEPCLGEDGRGNAGAGPGSAVALRFAEQKSSNPGNSVAIAYAVSGASNCAVNATSTTPMRKRDFMAPHCTAVVRDANTPAATRHPTDHDIVSGLGIAVVTSLRPQ
jgi:hypothetical protein